MMENKFDKQTMLLWRLAIGVAVFFIAGLVITAEPFRTLTYLAAIIILVLDFRPAKNAQFLEQIICVLITAGVFFTGRPSGAFAVVFFFQIVKYIENRCFNKNMKSMGLLEMLWSHFAHVESDGEYVKKQISEIKEGDVIVVKAGERIPLDGVIITGDSFMDMRAFTGEAAPREVHPGDNAISGAVNFGSTIYIRTTRNSDECSAEKIYLLMQYYEPSNTEAKLTRLYYRFMPCVFTAAVFLLLFAIIFDNTTKWVYTGLTIAAVLSPYMLLSSVISAFKAAISGCGIDGVLFGGGKYIEQLAKSKTPENEIVINADDPAAAVEETMNSGKTAVITSEPRLERAVSAARRTVRTVRINTIAAVSVKLAIIALAVSGHIGIWGAVATDTIASIIILTNSTRTGRKG